MPLSFLPTLETYINAFNNSKRFYHFNHSDHVLSIKLLKTALKQYNTGISELAVIEKAILEIKRSQGLFALVTDINLKVKIARFYQERANLLATLKNLIDSIEKGASRLQPVIGERVGCDEFKEKLLELLQKENLTARQQALAEEKFDLMQISSKEGMLLDKDQFAAFHQFILQQATPEIRHRYRRLNWYIENPLDEKLIPIEIKNKSFYVLSSAKITFEQKIGGLSQLFFGEKDKLKLIEEQYYQVASIKSAQQAINTIYHTLTPDSFEQCALPEQPCLKTVIKLETEIKRRRVALQGERITGMMKFFFGVKNAAINHELNYLNRHFAVLQGKKITLMENVLAHLETHYHFKDLVLPPKEKLDAIKMLLSECEKGVSLIPLDTPRQQEIATKLSAFRKKFKSCCNISVNLIEKLIQENNYLSAQRMTSSTGLSYLSYSKEAENLFDRIRNYVSPSQQEAIDVLASVLLGTSLAPLDSIKQKLLPLFGGFKSPLKCLEVFIESFFKNYILPALHSPESYHFQLLTNYNSKWIDNWLSKKTTSLEDALIFLRTLYSGQVTLGNQVRSIRNKPFVYDRQTFIAQIKLLQSFGKQAQSKSFLESFYSIITQTIKEQEDQLCFHPDYLAGILVLKDDQLKITYIQALMKSCISKQTFDILQNKELIDYLNGSNAFEAVRDPLFAYFKQDQWQYALQSVLDQLEDETLAQEYRYIYLKNRIEHNDTLFDDGGLKSLGDDLSKAIGQENELNLYQLLARRLSSEETIPPESLALIDSLLAANWSQNINGLRILFGEKRQLLVAQSEVTFEIKELLNMIKLHHFEKALNKIKEHILLSTTQNDRSTLHFDIVLGFLNQLAHFHQEKEDLGLPEKKTKWAFYRALKQAIHASQWEARETSNTKKDAWLSGFAQMEGILKNNQAVAKLKDNEAISPHLNRPCIQAMIAASLIKNSQSKNEIAGSASKNSSQENQLSDEMAFLLLDLIPNENKPPILSQVASHHAQWDVKWSNYLGRFANNETNQKYRCLFLKNFFSDLEFSEQNASVLPSATFQDFDKTYGQENLPLVFTLMENYLAEAANKEKKVGYQFILYSLKEAPVSSPWQKLHESAQAKISILENKSNIKETINEFKAMIQDKEYLAAKSKIEQWIMNTTTYPRTAPEFIHNQHLLESCKIILKKHLLKKLIPQKATFNIAFLRDFILVALPNDEEKKALKRLCNENSSHRFHSKNLDGARLYQCLAEFERKAVSHLQKSLPKFDCLWQLIEIAQKHSLYSLSRLKEQGHGYGLPKETVALYLKHQKMVDPILSAILSSRRYFIETIKQMCRCHAHAKKSSRDQKIPHLEHYQAYLNKKMAKWHGKNESPFHFFAKKPSNETTSLEDDWVAMDPANG